MSLRAVILWVHVLCGVVWIGACATFILGASASARESAESHAWSFGIVQRINRLCVPLAVAIPVTGSGNLFFAARARGSALPPEFIGIVGAKIALFAVMAASLAVAWRRAPKFGELMPTRICHSTATSAIRTVITSYAVIVAAGIAALGLGLWLSGT